MIPEKAPGTITRGCDVEARRAQGVRARAQVARHGYHRILGDRRDRRDQHDADHEPGAQDVEGLEPEAEVPQERREEHQREEAEDNRRDAGQDLERRFDDLAHAGTARTR